MIVNSNSEEIFVKKLFDGTNPQLPPVLFIHGFMGNSNDWNFLAEKLDTNFTLYAVDLIGHGNSSCPDEEDHYSYKSINSQLISILIKLNLKKVVIAGYSMGGRAALGFAVENPNLVEGLIMESATAGIENNNERIKRIKADKQLSENIRTGSIKSFLENWYENKLFASLTKYPELLKNEITIKTKNNPIGIANCVAGFSPGKMPSYWDKICGINIPVLLIAGKLDEKYVHTNNKMNNLFPNSELKIIKGAGHNTHLEKPVEFINFVNYFLDKLFKN